MDAGEILDLMDFPILSSYSEGSPAWPSSNSSGVTSDSNNTSNFGSPGRSFIQITNDTTLQSSPESSQGSNCVDNSPKVTQKIKKTKGM
jgi:hypothetical protein